MDANEQSPYLTVKEVARHLRVSVGTVYNLVKTRELVSRRIGSRSGAIRILKADLIEYEKGGCLNGSWHNERKIPATNSASVTGTNAIRPFKFIQLRQPPSERPGSSEQLAG